MWPLKTIARGAEFWWRWFQKSLWRLEVIWGHFGAILGPFRANLWPRTQNCCRLVMWPLKTTARGAEFWWRWFRKSLWTCWGHLGQFWGHFGAILGPFRANLWPQTQNCCRLVMWPLKMTARGAEFRRSWLAEKFRFVVFDRFPKGQCQALPCGFCP